MSEYCSQCAVLNDEETDYDLVRIALNLKKGYSESFICEGCDNRAVYKDEEGKIYLAKQIKGRLQLFPVKIEDL